MSNKAQYTEDNIRSLDWKEHIRMRPGMYIGKLGDGSSPDDGIYILIKEVLDNCIDEFVMGAGKTIEIKITENQAKRILTLPIHQYLKDNEIKYIADNVNYFHSKK